jgi:hypothetical protein
MSKKFLLQLIGTLIIVFCLSCIDIFETDLTDSKVELLAPADSLKTIEQSQKFWWNYLTGALWYELQVVSPDFSNISGVKLDTVIEINNFQLSLQPGVYHWRVRAINGSSTSEFNEYQLTIIESPK